jgi:peptidoglycan L-alanyl-D-glutamate endopeptidase CwlK
MEEAIKQSPCDFMITCGHRGKDEQNKAYYERKSKLKFPNSKHNQMPSKAIDFCPFVNGKLVWDNKQLFKDIIKHVKETADRLDVKISCGGDWKSFKDYPHIELI